jgi:hypothetical protein
MDKAHSMSDRSYMDIRLATIDKSKATRFRLVALEVAKDMIQVSSSEVSPRYNPKAVWY